MRKGGERGRASARRGAAPAKRLAKSPQRQKPAHSARVVALEMARLVLTESLTLDEAALDQREALKALGDFDARDRAFAQALVKALFRNWRRVEAVQVAFMERPFDRGALRSDVIMKLGITQLLALEMPAHAVVNETVELFGKHPQDRLHRGVVNAVLRRVDRELDDAKALFSRPKSAVAPGWMAERWIKAYGRERVHAMLSHLERPPVLCLSLRNDASVPASATEDQKRPNSVFVPDPPADVTKIAGFARGNWWVQDLAAAEPARWLNERLATDSRVVDVCAAPGGKTLQLAAAGHQVTSVDLSESRLERLRANLRRMQLEAQVEVIAADALTFKPDAPVDAVLIDAPCSATGTIRRHPELPHLRTPKGLLANVELQRGMIEAAAQWLRPGGLLVYAVCSLESEEGEGQVQASLLPNELKLIETARILPGELSEQGNDGFFIALLEKRAA